MVFNITQILAHKYSSKVAYRQQLPWYCLKKLLSLALDIILFCLYFFPWKIGAKDINFWFNFFLFWHTYCNFCCAQRDGLRSSYCNCSHLIPCVGKGTDNLSTSVPEIQLISIFKFCTRVKGFPPLWINLRQFNNDYSSWLGYVLIIWIWNVWSYDWMVVF